MLSPVPKVTIQAKFVCQKLANALTRNVYVWIAADMPVHGRIHIEQVGISCILMELMNFVERGKVKIPNRFRRHFQRRRNNVQMSMHDSLLMLTLTLHTGAVLEDDKVIAINRSEEALDMFEDFESLVQDVMR